jgi:DNA-binding transcriptional LysR family regulator
METRNLITFLKAVELKNFYQVSQALGYVPSTVTMQIKALEDELGQPLFDRVGKRIQLTEFGMSFLPYANRIIALNKEALSLTDTQKEPHGLIRCGSIESYLSNVLGYYLPIFTKLHPSINISVRQGNSLPLFKMLKQGEVDLIFCLNEDIVDQDFYCVFQRPVPIFFAASRKNKLAKLKNIPLKTILSQPLVLSESSGRYRKILGLMATKQGLSVNPMLGLENTGVIRRMVSNNLGITFLPEYCLRRDILKNHIIALDSQEKVQPLFLQIYYNKNKWISPALKTFIEFIVNEENKA